MLISYTLVSAFTHSGFKGNPAAVVFPDTETLQLSTLKSIALNFNQPVTAFITFLAFADREEKNLEANARFITGLGVEIELCGHGSIAAAKAILEHPGFVGRNVERIDLKTNNGRSISVEVLQGGELQVTLPAAPAPSLLSEEATQQIKTIVDVAFGRHVNINCVYEGGKGFQHGA